MKRRGVTFATLKQNYEEGSFFPYQILAPYNNIKKHNCLTAAYRNILVENTKILHTDNHIKKLKILQALYLKFRQPTIIELTLKLAKLYFEIF